jgi:hypothetical protein
VSEPKELREALTLVVELSKSVEKMLKNGKVGMEDLGHLISLLPTLGPGLLGLDKLPGEFKNLTVSEARKLVDWFKAEFDIEADQAEMIVEKTFDAALALAIAFNLLKKG